MNRAMLIAVAVGTVIGTLLASVIVLAAAFLGKADGIRTIDLWSFSLVMMSVIMAALAVVIVFAASNTWNSIDRRADASIQRYSQEAHKEIERNATERQKALDESADKAISTFRQLQDILLTRNRNLTLELLGLLGLYVLVGLWMQYRGKKHNVD